MATGIITGSGTPALPGFAGAEIERCRTPYGTVQLSRGELGGQPVLHVSRHGAGHVRLSNLVTHRANVWALRELGAGAVIGATACGGVDPELAPGSLVIFDDLHFPSNRLPGGELCTFFDQPSDPERAHWVLDGGPFSPGLREALASAAAEAGVPARATGTYGHVDGPRFNTPSEIAQLAGCGVVAVSQTGGPETVLCGELELPYALVGFVTDHANQVRPGQSTAVSQLMALMAASTDIFSALLTRAVQQLAAGEPPRAAGTVLRLGNP